MLELKHRQPEDRRQSQPRRRIPHGCHQRDKHTDEEQIPDDRQHGEVDSTRERRLPAKISRLKSVRCSL
ncbi:MAG: hypothetical protein MZV63_19535 [Marinilabiliales bacterium]|nr:hypothetical protein [Marinilabiliales bacterium]